MSISQDHHGEEIDDFSGADLIAALLLSRNSIPKQQDTSQVITRTERKRLQFSGNKRKWHRRRANLARSYREAYEKAERDATHIAQTMLWTEVIRRVDDRKHREATRINWQSPQPVMPKTFQPVAVEIRELRYVCIRSHQLEKEMSPKQLAEVEKYELRNAADMIAQALINDGYLHEERHDELAQTVRTWSFLATRRT